MVKFICLLLPVLALAGCGAPRPIRAAPEQTVLDDRLSCAHLQGEFALNQSRLQEVGGEEARRSGDNLARTAGMGLFAGAMFHDNGRSNRVETATLQARNQRLRMLAAQRGCGI